VTPAEQYAHAQQIAAKYHLEAGQDEAERNGYDDEHGEPLSDDEKRNLFEYKVIDRLSRLRVDTEARRRLDAETNPPPPLPPIKSLDTLLAEPDTPTAYRVDKVMPLGGRVIMSAQFKAGKTTVRDNLLRALVDGEPFLGRFDVTTPARRVALIDTEMSENTMRRWLRDQRITNTAAVADVVALRGRAAAFNLLDDRCRRHWATRFADQGVDYVMLDCLRPILDALGLDENHDAGRFLTAFDALLTDAGSDDALVVQHMGHAGERARGDSRLQDWPEAIWRIVRETDDPASPRYFTAYGRDVGVPEGRLGYDPATRRLSYIPGNRGDTKTEAAYQAVVELLTQDAPLSGHAIETQLGDHTRDHIRDACRRGTRWGTLRTETGPRGAKLHHIAHPCTQCRRPVTTGSDRHKSCPTHIETDGLFT
jgi:AAA domain